LTRRSRSRCRAESSWFSTEPRISASCRKSGLPRSLSHPRIGHLHVTVDNLPWHFVVADDSNSIIVAGLPAGPHELGVELADPTHRELGGPTVKFVAPGNAPQMH